MHNRLAGQLVAALVLSFTARSWALTPETASYPEKKPCFKVDVPVGWEAKHENGALKLIAEANAVVLCQFVQNIKDDATAKTALPQLAEMEGKQFDLQNMQVSYHVRDVDAGEFKGLMTDARGVDHGGHNTLWQSFIFAPKEGEYYLVTALWTEDDEAKTAGDRAAVIKSLHSLNMQGQ